MCSNETDVSTPERQDTLETESDLYLHGFAVQNLTDAFDGCSFASNDTFVGNEYLSGFSGLLPEAEEPCSIFVGDLGRHVSEDMIANAFMQYGTVESVQIKRDRESGNSLGYCFVNFRDPESAANARRFGHRIKIGSRAVRIGRAQRNTSLYVPSLHPSTSSEELRECFSQFGDLVEVCIDSCS
mmetsp:Transcript_988/g.1872  ORF Transcript_988/g.1872 Transcript_988/m.1872 type:complete len:184 (-) Transcript_988:472-1023(-)